MGEFNDTDFTVERDDDSDLVRQLRRLVKDKDQEIKTLKGEVDAFRTQTVESAIKDALKGVPDGKRDKVEKLLRKEAKSPDDVQSWLDEYGDVFGVGTQDPGSAAETPGNGADGGANGGGVDESTRAAFEAARAAEGGGQPAPQLGAEAVSKFLSDLKAQGKNYDEAIAALRERGLVQ